MAGDKAIPRSRWERRRAAPHLSQVTRERDGAERGGEPGQAGRLLTPPPSPATLPRLGSKKDATPAAGVTQRFPLGACRRAAVGSVGGGGAPPPPPKLPRWAVPGSSAGGKGRVGPVSLSPRDRLGGPLRRLRQGFASRGVGGRSGGGVTPSPSPARGGRGVGPRGRCPGRGPSPSWPRLPAPLRAPPLRRARRGGGSRPHRSVFSLPRSMGRAAAPGLPRVAHRAFRAPR